MKDVAIMCELATELPIGLFDPITIHVKRMDGEILSMMTRPTDVDLYHVYEMLMNMDPIYHPHRTYLTRLHEKPHQLLEDGEIIFCMIGDWIPKGWYRPFMMVDECNAVVIENVSAGYEFYFVDRYGSFRDAIRESIRDSILVSNEAWEQFEQGCRTHVLDVKPIRVGDSIIGPFHYTRNTQYGDEIHIVNVIGYMVLRYNGRGEFQRCIHLIDRCELDLISMPELYSRDYPYNWHPNSTMYAHRYICHRYICACKG